ncbi:LRR receptor-like serine threonine-protein kinase At4g08850-like [Seminavis robusta]|uniref:LRR receptor-like serine threonine-protein kinase At4g08850-like n=1 Tax=Seminavis robusta TaxID=568900 RepID=A0A9N8HJQ9_9STRA|nr:LRR receptor-like serine threonine-protein kinase At4g08850-like [Seminavis robusta]|eukprot:Sro566_g167840.1 LRR receptor-like serine threonine-protein kinase At4g08850-like (741) ;mRNA; r:35489-38314
MVIKRNPDALEDIEMPDSSVSSEEESASSISNAEESSIRSSSTSTHLDQSSIRSGSSVNLDHSSLQSGTASLLDVGAFTATSVTQHYSTQVGSAPQNAAPGTKEADDMFNLARHYQSATGPANRNTKTTAFTAQGFFAPSETFDVDQSVNFMDHNRANYTPPPPRLSTARSRFQRNRGSTVRGSSFASFVSVFLSGRTGVGSAGSGDTGTGVERSEEEEDKPSIWPRLGAWFVILLSFGLAAAFLALSVPHLSKRSFSNGPSDEEEARKRHQAIHGAVLASGLTHPRDLDNYNASQFYALQWLTETDPAKLEADDPGLPKRYALATFYYSNHPEIASDHSKGTLRRLSSGWEHQANWMTRSDICHWYGIICETVNQHNKDVVHWNMTANNLKGSIPSEIVALSNLVSLDLSSNSLSGTLPTVIYAMPFLKDLMLSDNALNGTISDEIGFFYPAETIDLSKNELQGSLPASINRGAVNLRLLNVADNDLKGTLPDITRLTKLSHLLLNENKFEGQFPVSLTSISSIVQINMENNMLTGSLPPEIKELSNLEILALGHNSFNGAIPDVLGELHNLTEIRLQKNLLEHKLPVSLGKLSKLKTLMLDSNKLIGSIPDKWMDMVELEALILHKNALTGSIASDMGRLVHLQDLWLNKNHITGTLPSQLGLLTDLVTLYLEHNDKLEGPVPTELGNLNALEALRMAKTALTGVVPEEVCRLKMKFELVFVSASCNSLRCICCDKCS